MADTKKSGSDAGANLEKSTVAPDLQQAADEAADKGYYGDAVDPTPNEHYSLETPPSAPTPETDEEMAKKAYGEGAIRSRFSASSGDPR